MRRRPGGGGVPEIQQEFKERRSTARAIQEHAATDYRESIPAREFFGRTRTPALWAAILCSLVMRARVSRGAASGQGRLCHGLEEQAEAYRADDPPQVMESRRPKMNIVEDRKPPPQGRQRDDGLSTSKVPIASP